MNQSDHIPLFASIPFVRNLVEYILKGKESEEYKTLTNIIHYPLDSKNELTMGHYRKICDNYRFVDKINLSPTDESRPIQEMLEDVANTICRNNKPTNATALEEKIVLAMACRRKSEKYMLDIINSKNIHIIPTLPTP